jgi:hypothetical protein
MAFDPSLPAYFRRRLSRSARPNRVFEAVRQVMKATGVLKGKHRRALDSTVLDDAVATQITVTQLIAAVRAVIREVPGAADVAAVQCTAHDDTDPGKPRIAWNDEQARADLVDALITDALRLLGNLPDQQLGEKAANAVGILALVAGQDVEPAEDSDGRDGRWRITQGTAPNRMVSTVDPEPGMSTRPAATSRTDTRPTWPSSPRPGYIPRFPCGLAPEASTTRPLSASAFSHRRTPRWTPSATPPTPPATPPLPRRSRARLFSKPAPLRPAVPGGFTLDDFAIDTTAATVTCPAGHTVPLSAPGGQHQQRKAAFKDWCTGCPLRERCTKAKTGRILTIRPHHDLQAATRDQAATDPVWRDDYRRWRPPVERALAWLVQHGNRRPRYRGTLANDAWLHTRAAALNLRRLINLGLTRTNNTWHLTTATA